jgi:hypothetical protein
LECGGVFQMCKGLMILLYPLWNLKVPMFLTFGYNIMIQVVVVDCNGKFLLPIFVGFPTNVSKVLFKSNMYKNVQMFFTPEILIESKIN